MPAPKTMTDNMLPTPNPTASAPEDQDAEKHRNSVLISLVVLLVYLSVTSMYASFLRQMQDWQLYAIIFIAGIQTAIAVYALRLSLSGHTQSSVTLLLSTLMIGIPSVSLFISGLGLSLGIGSLVGFYLIATLGLNAQLAKKFTWPILISSALNILFDFFITTPRITIPFVSIVIPILTVLGVGVFVLVYLRTFSSLTLRTKLIIAFILITTIPLSIFSFILNNNTRNILNENATADLLELSVLAAQSVDGLIATQLDILRTEAQEPALIEYLKLSPSQRARSPQESAVQQVLQSFARRDPVFIHSYAILDTQGNNLMDTFPEHQLRFERNYSYFRQMIGAGMPYASNLIFTEEGEINLYFSAPIRDSSGNILGILRAEMNANVLQNILKKLLPSQHTDQVLALVDSSTFVRVAYTGNLEEKFRSYQSFNSQEIAAFQIEGRMPAGNPASVLAPVPEMVAGLRTIDTQPVFLTPSSTLKDNALAVATRLKSQPWYAVAMQAEKSAFAPAAAQTRALLLITLAMAGLAAAAAVFVANILVQPVIKLTEVAQKISAGDLTAQAQISTLDEIGTLANTLNLMTTELNKTLTGLEEIVNERTAELTSAREQSEVRARQLTIISEVSRAIASEQNLDRLLPLITRLVSEKFGFYHIGIFLIDETNMFAVLRAANSDGGQRMLARGHRLAVGQVGIVGYVAKTGNPRIALDVGADATYFNNPDLPRTRSEMALPLKVRDTIIGVLDVQSTEPAAFDENDVSILSILADQIAIAIDNARLFGESQQALNELQAVYNQFTRQEWSALASQLDAAGYIHTLSGGRQLNELVQTEPIREALMRGEVVIVAPKTADEDPAMVMPVKLRGQVIGVLNVKSPIRGHIWSADEINMVQSVSDRLALALENARLFNQAQRRAATERAIGDVSSKLSASTNIDDILRLTVEELGRLLKDSEIAIQIGDGIQK